MAGTPGIVDADGTVLVCVAPRDWVGDHVRTALRRLVGPDCHVQVENDANLAAVAEHRSRGADRPPNLVYFLAGQGLGLGIIIGDALHRGRGGRAGEIAIQRISPLATASAWLAKHKDDDIPALLRRARRGDHDAEQDAAGLLEPLATGLATLVYTIDPDLIVLGGRLADAGSAVLDPTRSLLDPLCRGHEVPIETSTLGTWAVTQGARDLALDHAHHRMFTTH